MVLKLFQNFKCLFQNFQFARFFGQYFKFGAIFFLNFSKFCAGIAIFQKKSTKCKQHFFQNSRKKMKTKGKKNNKHRFQKSIFFKNLNPKF